jgi:hypothetical protein
VNHERVPDIIGSGHSGNIFFNKNKRSITLYLVDLLIDPLTFRIVKVRQITKVGSNLYYGTRLQSSEVCEKIDFLRFSRLGLKNKRQQKNTDTSIFPIFLFYSHISDAL